MRILLIASDQDRAEYIEWLLQDEGLNLFLTDLGEEGPDLARRFDYDIILLDPHLRDISGPEVLKRLRDSGVKTPVVIVSDQAGVEEMSRGFGFGAAAYVTVPVDCEDLSACLYGVVGRPLPPRRLIEVGGLRVDLTRQRVRINGERVHLSGREYQIVELLALRRGEIVTKEAMLAYVYDGIDALEVSIINVYLCHARRIMRAVAGGHDYIETVWGKGYRLREAVNLATTLYIDADACPVKDEAMRVAERHGLTIHFVSNAFMRLPEGPLIKRVVVSDGPDAADDWIVAHAAKGDIVVTADIPLAARCLKAGARVIGPTGKPFTEAGIGMALAMRDLSRHLRETGESKGYNASFTRADRSRFLQVLEDAVQAIKRSS